MHEYLFSFVVTDGVAGIRGFYNAPFVFVEAVVVFGVDDGEPALGKRYETSVADIRAVRFGVEGGFVLLEIRTGAGRLDNEPFFLGAFFVAADQNRSAHAGG